MADNDKKYTNFIKYVTFYFILSKNQFYVQNNISRKPLPFTSYRSCTPVNNFHCTEQAYEIPDFVSFQRPGNRFWFL